MTFFLSSFRVGERQGTYSSSKPSLPREEQERDIYCYTDEERSDAIAKLGGKAEITRFKGLGEISPDEFGGFMVRIFVFNLSCWVMDTWQKSLSFYMGKNTPDRQEFIIDNLRIEMDKVERKEEVAEEVAEEIE
jgi:topoisomerase-4 subunit B